jgi:hypothetical protein
MIKITGRSWALRRTHIQKIAQNALRSCGGVSVSERDPIERTDTFGLLNKEKYGLPLSIVTWFHKIVPEIESGDLNSAAEYIMLVKSIVANATNFDVRLDREVVKDIMKQRILPKHWHIMCQEYGEDDDWVGLDYDDFAMEESIEDIPSDWQTFELWLPLDLEPALRKQCPALLRQTQEPGVGVVEIECSQCGYKGAMVDDREMCPQCLDTVGVGYIDEELGQQDLEQDPGITLIPKEAPKDALIMTVHLNPEYQFKLEQWKILTNELVDSAAIGHQFWGFIQACIDEVNTNEKEEKDNGNER